MPKRVSRRRGWLALGVSCAGITSAVAQQSTVPVVPSIADPSAASRQQQTLPQPASLGPGIAIPESTGDAPPPAGADARFVLSGIELRGVSVYRAETLLAPYQDWVGKEISVAQVFQLANDLTARYRKDGWVYSRVLVPAQEITAGRVVLQAVEGFANEVEFSGTSGRRHAYEERIREKLASQKPLRQESLERYVLLMNDVPGASATAALSPSQKQVGGLKVAAQLDQDRFDVTAGASNRGSRVLGPEQFDLSLTLNSILGGYDSTRLSYVTTGSNRELEYYSLGQTWLVSSEGTRLEIAASHSDSKPDLGVDFEALNLETESNSYSLTLSHPIVRSRRSNLSVRLAGGYHEGKTNDSFQAPREDRIPSVRLGFTFDALDSAGGVNIADLQLSKGFESGNATRSEDLDSSRPGASADYEKVELYLARLQSLSRGLSVLLALQGQYAGSDLLSPEEFAFGGPLFGRAFDPSELAGDSGAAGKFELRYSIVSGDPLIPPATVYAFYDAGVVFRRNPQPGEKDKDSATAAGGGVRFNIGRHVHGYVEGAVPLTQIVAAEGNDDARVFAGVSLSF